MIVMKTGRGGGGLNDLGQGVLGTLIIWTGIQSLIESLISVQLTVPLVGIMMPFGLANAPSVFQAFVNDILREMLEICFRLSGRHYSFFVNA